MSIMEKVLEQYGLFGLLLSALAAYIIRLETSHRKERKEWRETEERNFDRSLQREDETNKVIRENTNILQGLKTLLENRK